MPAVGKSKEADAARCRRHPRHRHSAGVCPFCLRDRLARLSSAAAGVNASASPSSSASSPRSSGEESIASAHAPPCRDARRARLGLLMRQEERETTVDLGAGRGLEEAPEEKKATRRSNFWARLQQLHHGSWHRKDGCALAHSKAVEGKSAVPKRAPLF